MQIIGTAGIYRFEPYDVLQIRKENWVDFSTIRTDTEAALAVGIIDSVRFDNVAGKFRIVRNNPALGNVVYPIPAPVATVQAQNAHTATPWSTSDMSYKLSKGVVWYNTPSHGGFAFTEAAAQRLLTPAAIARAERYAGRLWFEEDCLASLVLLEHPEYMDMLGARASEADLLASIKTYNPGYLAERGLL